MVIYVKMLYSFYMSHDRKINPLGLYHIYNRGNNKGFIFIDEFDMIYFLKLVNKYKKKYNITVYAYCLMGTHFHFYVDDIDGNISAFMRDIESRYAEYFNKKYKRTGHVFQGPFGSCIVIGYLYSIGLVRYIGRNPVKAKLVCNYKSYRFSSFGSSNDNLKVVDPQFVEMLFQNAGVDMESYMDNNEDDKLIAYIEKMKYDDEQANIKYVEILQNEFDMKPEEFSKAETEKKMKILIRCRYIGLSMRQLKEITNLEAGFIRRASIRDLEYLETVCKRALGQFVVQIGPRPFCRQRNSRRRFGGCY